MPMSRHHHDIVATSEQASTSEDISWTLSRHQNNVVTSNQSSLRSCLTDQCCDIATTPLRHRDFDSRTKDNVATSTQGSQGGS